MMNPMRQINSLRNQAIPFGIVGLLAELGMNVKLKSCTGRPRPHKIAVLPTSFWKRNDGLLPYIFHDACKLYRRRIKSLHPDVNGNHEACLRLNLVWQRVKKLFKQKLGAFQ